MVAWIKDNLEWLLPAVAGLFFFVSYVHGRTDRGESLPRALLIAWFPFLDPENTYARQTFWLGVFGKVFMLAIIVVLLIAGYVYF
jgi:hypothetical protein